MTVFKSAAIVCFVLVVTFSCARGVTQGQETQGQESPSQAPQDATIQQSTSRPEEDLRQLQQLMAVDAGASLNRQLTDIGRKYLPAIHIDDSKWGQQKEFDRLLPRNKPLMLNHGTWRKFQARPVRPEETFRIRLKNLRCESAKIYFTLECDGLLDLEARQAKWVRGVQLYSINAQGDAKITLSLDCAVWVGFDFRSEPTMVIQPEIKSADIVIHEFQIHRISKVGGEFAQQVTRAARDWLDDREEKHEAKLVAKINRQIQKKQDRLRIPLK